MLASPTKQYDTPATTSSTPARPSKRLKRSSPDAELNVESVVLGSYLIKPSFPSLYRDEVVGSGAIKRLYVCKGCFKYTKDAAAHIAHRRFCEHINEPPGDLVYAKGRYAILEVDGEEYPLLTQNLSLFAKLFIDTKSVCFDASTFLFYLLVDKHPSQLSSDPGYDPNINASPQIIGFFSKEKLSWDNNNLACILIFPPWQKIGLGQLLMAASYELSKRDGRIGGPERPLSAAGATSYAQYWSRTVGQLLLKSRQNKPMTIEDISAASYILADDIVGALIAMGLGGTDELLNAKDKGKGKRKDGSLVVDKVIVRKWLLENRIDVEKEVIDIEAFVDRADEGFESDGEESDVEGE